MRMQICAKIFLNYEYSDRPSHEYSFDDFMIPPEPLKSRLGAFHMDARQFVEPLERGARSHERGGCRLRGFLLLAAGCGFASTSPTFGVLHRRPGPHCATHHFIGVNTVAFRQTSDRWVGLLSVPRLPYPWCEQRRASPTTPPGMLGGPHPKYVYCTRLPSNSTVSGPRD
jgi:hypothetical protein